MASSVLVRCDIEVRESDLERALDRLRANGLEVAQDEPPPGAWGAPQTLAVWRVRDASAAVPNLDGELSLLLEVLSRTLDAAGTEYVLVAAHVEHRDDPIWWRVLVGSPATPNGMRVRAHDDKELDEQLHALSRFLGVPRSQLDAVPDQDPNSASTAT